MADLINLRRVRKRVEREQQAKDAEANRIRHGRSKAERQLEKARDEKVARSLDGHRLTPEGEAG